MTSSADNDLRVDRAPAYLGLAGLLRLNFSGADLVPLCQSLLQWAETHPHEANALLDAGIIFQIRGNRALALQLQQQALLLQRHYRLPARQPIKLRLLALMAPGEMMANVPIECLLENSDIELNILYTSGDEVEPLEYPAHDVLFVAIGESAANRPILAAWLPRLAAWPRPVLNDPRHIARVARDNAAQRLHALPGVAMPPTLRIARSTLQQIIAAFPPANRLPDNMDFPLLLRPLDSHAGHDLYKIDNCAALSAKLAAMDGEQFFISSFIDYRSDDGLFRKFRVILIDGQPFACHMGISEHWMIHYLNAGMAEPAGVAKRAEEARFMADFEHDFARRHGAALAAIDRSIGLNYLGIDCAETRDGRLLIFEVDPAMVVHAMDPIDIFPYKQAPMQKLFTAFRAMLINAAASRVPVE